MVGPLSWDKIGQGSRTWPSSRIMPRFRPRCAASRPKGCNRRNQLTIRVARQHGSTLCERRLPATCYTGGLFHSAHSASKCPCRTEETVLRLGLLTITVAASVLLSSAHAGAQGKPGADKLYILNCGEGVAGDVSRWSPGVDVGKSMDFVDNCYLIHHAQGWLLWDT